MKIELGATWFTSRRVTLAVSVTALLGLWWMGAPGPIASVEAAETCSASPGSGDYCTSAQCGPCMEGEGDCDPGQCGAGLTCVEEGAVDHCRASAPQACTAQPGASDFCSSSQCGPCLEGQGDCDAGQCGAGLTCLEEGTIDRCRRIDGGCSALPDSSEYCAASGCGPCEEGEGDCEPGECGPGLYCAEEGAIDRCRPWNGASNLQVKVNGVWKGICCNGSRLELSNQACWWTEGDRIVTDETVNLEMDCNEGNPQACDCDTSGERLHGINGGAAANSLTLSTGGPLYPDYRMNTCVYVTSTGQLATKWTDASCPSFRLR